MTMQARETGRGGPAVKSSSFLAQELAARGQRSLHLFAYLPISYPKTTLMFCLASAVLASLYAVQSLEFVAGRNDLISSKKRYVRLYEDYANEFMGLDKVLVVVEPTDEQQGKDFVTHLGESLERDTGYVREVLYRLNTTSLEGKKLLYLPPEALRALYQHLSASKELVSQLAAAPGL